MGLLPHTPFLTLGSFLPHRFPKAMIVSIEPSSKTFTMLHLNTARFSNVIRVHSGLWSHVTRLAIVQMGRFDGKVVGAFTIQVMEVDKVQFETILDSS